MGWQRGARPSPPRASGVGQEPSTAFHIRPEHPADRIPCATPGPLLLSPTQPLLAPAPGAPRKRGASPRHVRKPRHGAAACPRRARGAGGFPAEMGQGNNERPQPRSWARSRTRHKSRLPRTRPRGSSQALGKPSVGRAGARWERIGNPGGERRALTARPCPLPAGAVPREATELSLGELTRPLHRAQPLESLKCR